MGFGLQVGLALGMTLEELPGRAKLTPSYVGSVEADRRDPSLSTVLALAAGLRLSPADLLGGRGQIGPIELNRASTRPCTLAAART